MKALKRLLVVICFLSVFSITAYGGGYRQCECNTGRVPGHIVKDDPVWIGNGYPVAWTLYISSFAEIEPSYTLAQITGFADYIPHPPYLDYLNPSMSYTFYEETKTGTSFSYDGVTIHLICEAKAGGGSARSIVIVNW